MDNFKELVKKLDLPQSSIEAFLNSEIYSIEIEEKNKTMTIILRKTIVLLLKRK